MANSTYRFELPLVIQVEARTHIHARAAVKALVAETRQVLPAGVSLPVGEETPLAATWRGVNASLAARGLRELTYGEMRDLWATIGCESERLARQPRVSQG